MFSKKAKLQNLTVKGRYSLAGGSSRYVALTCQIWHINDMRFERLIEIVGDEPIFESGLLLAGAVDAAHVRRQLSRWTQAGQVYQLRRGLYALAPPFQRVKPHPFLVANRLVRGSYVSCQSALAHYGLIPEYVARVISITPRRTEQLDTALGSYDFRHLKTALLFGYTLADLGGGQQAFVATPEKALLDLVYLQPGGDSSGYLHGLRLQNLGQLNLDRLHRQAKRAGSPKLERAAAHINALAEIEAGDYKTL